jgi:hypothetical protein
LLAIVGTAVGALAQVPGTQALFTAAAKPQTVSITANWTPKPVGCIGKYDWTVHTSSHDWESKLHDDSIVYVDSDGTWDFEYFKHLCLIVTVWHVTFRHLYKDCFLDFVFPQGWLCFPFPSLSTCGWVGDDYEKGRNNGNGSSGGKGLHGLALNAQPAGSDDQSDSSDDPFEDEVQAELSAGGLDSLAIATDPSDEPSPDASDTSSAAASAGASFDEPSGSVHSSGTTSDKPSPTDTKTATASPTPTPTAGDTDSSGASPSDTADVTKTTSTSSGNGT